MASAGLIKELRIVLIGKTGVGKSCLGNSLLQRRGYFHSEISAKNKCALGTRNLDDGSMLMIADTPGLFDTAVSNATTKTEIVKCIGITSPGPHIFIFVLSVARFTSEEVETITYMKETFGDGVMNHVIVVFTGKDALDDDDEPMTIQQFVAKSPEFLRQFVNIECKGRYTAICNKSRYSGHENDVQSVIDLIRRTVSDNDNRYYIAKMFENAESVMLEEITERRQQKPELTEDVIRELIRMGIQQHNQQLVQELRIVLVGKTGVGKSSLGNSLLGRPGIFPSKMGGESVTKECSRGTRYLDDGSMLMIVDTPDLFDTSVPNEITKTEIVKCIGITSPGPHIFILVLNLIRFTPEELETIKYLKATFGDGVMNHVIVVFTGKDALDDDYDDNPMTIQQYVAKRPNILKNFVNIECKGRYTDICNKFKNSGHTNDVQSVIDLIRRTVSDNDNRYYTAKMFENAKSAIQDEIEERRQQKPELTEDAIRELIRMGIQEHSQQLAQGMFCDSLESSAKSGLSNLAAVVTLPVTVPLTAGRAVYDRFSNVKSNTR